MKHDSWRGLLFDEAIASYLPNVIAPGTVRTKDDVADFDFFRDRPEEAAGEARRNL